MQKGYRAGSGKQEGVSLSGLLVTIVIVIFVAVSAMKMVPAYLEFNAAKRAAIRTAQDSDKNASVNDIRKRFQSSIIVDNITSVTADSIDVSKDGGEFVVSFSYQKVVPLFANISLLFDFSASSADK